MDYIKNGRELFREMKKSVNCASKTAFSEVIITFKRMLRVKIKLEIIGLIPCNLSLCFFFIQNIDDLKNTSSNEVMKIAVSDIFVTQMNCCELSTF